MSEVWKELKKEFIEAADPVLLRCYFNTHTYGLDGYYHTDSNRDDEYTIVIYLCDEWKPDWGGQTNILQDGEITHSFVPKPNRGIIFPGNFWHGASGVSRIFYGIRKTLMFKFRKKRTAQFEELSNWLIAQGARGPGHKKGTLHDHLMRTYQVLSDGKNTEEYVAVAGGLHSVFGTNKFENNILTPGDYAKVSAKWGKPATELAMMFSSIDRPKTLEEPGIDHESKLPTLDLRDGRKVKVELEMLTQLRQIEKANLLDQGEGSNYPNIMATEL